MPTSPTSMTTTAISRPRDLCFDDPARHTAGGGLDLRAHDHAGSQRDALLPPRRLGHSDGVDRQHRQRGEGPRLRCVREHPRLAGYGEPAVYVHGEVVG